jgi:uroporphyrinogen-III decarboxylase
MLDRVQAISLFRERIGGEKLIEGWIEGPCGSGANLRGINRLMLDFYDDPGFVRDLFGFCVDMGLRFGRAQQRQAQNMIGIGDPAACSSAQLYERVRWPYERQLVEGLHAMGGQVRLHICGNTPHPRRDGTRGRRHN